MPNEKLEVFRFKLLQLLNIQILYLRPPIYSVVNYSQTIHLHLTNILINNSYIFIHCSLNNLRNYLTVKFHRLLILEFYYQSRITISSSLKLKKGLNSLYM